MEINRNDFIQQLVDKHHYTKNSATTLVADFIDMIVENMENGNSVSFQGFGRFDIIERKARSCPNPQTGEKVDVPAHLVPRFYPGNHMKYAVKKFTAKRGGGFDG